MRNMRNCWKTTGSATVFPVWVAMSCRKIILCSSTEIGKREVPCIRLPRLLLPFPKPIQQDYSRVTRALFGP